MKRTLALLLAALFVLLIGCGSEYRPVKPVGAVPEEFVPIVVNNLFCSYSLASPNGILRSVQTDADGEGHTDTIDFFKYDTKNATMLWWHGSIRPKPDTPRSPT